VALPYGFVKAKISSEPVMKGSRHRSEIQYHQHFSLLVAGAGWDVAVNVGTNDADDLLKYKLVFDFRHPSSPRCRRRPRDRMISRARRTCRRSTSCTATCSPARVPGATATSWTARSCPSPPPRSGD
jgi:hypothetical protein